MSGECEKCGEHCLECRCGTSKEFFPSFTKKGGGGHECNYDYPFSVYGPAITNCWEDDDGRLCVSNGEYMSQVNFCPFCGKGAKVRVDGTEM